MSATALLAAQARYQTIGSPKQAVAEEQFGESAISGTLSVWHFADRCGSNFEATLRSCRR
jgi:hypothetical protein